MLKYLNAYFAKIKDKEPSFDCSVILRSGAHLTHLNLVEVRTDLTHFEQLVPDIPAQKVPKVLVVETSEISGFKHP